MWVTFAWCADNDHPHKNIDMLCVAEKAAQLGVAAETLATLHFAKDIAHRRSPAAPAAWLLPMGLDMELANQTQMDRAVCDAWEGYQLSGQLPERRQQITQSTLRNVIAGRDEMAEVSKPAVAGSSGRLPVRPL